jgi:hypothetical protein
MSKKKVGSLGNFVCSAGFLCVVGFEDAGPKILLLSMNNPAGCKRRERVGKSFLYTHIVGCDYDAAREKYPTVDLKDSTENGRMFCGHYEEKYIKNTCGCYGAHLSCLDHIIDNHLEGGVIVLEDDSVIKRKIFDAIQWGNAPVDTISLLNGVLIAPYPESHRKPPPDGLIESLNPGFNKYDPNIVGFINTSAYFVPSVAVAEYAKKKLTEPDTYYAMDRMMKTRSKELVDAGETPIIGGLHYPSGFKCDDDGSSQIGNSDFGVLDNYRMVKSEVLNANCGSSSNADSDKTRTLTTSNVKNYPVGMKVERRVDPSLNGMTVIKSEADDGANSGPGKVTFAKGRAATDASDADAANIFVSGDSPTNGGGC